jgi:ribonucleotide reductase beta subunit family protein with ferritin-like domain
MNFGLQIFFTNKMSDIDSYDEKRDEPILQDDPTRFTMFPLKHLDLWNAYTNHMKAFWSHDEIDYPADKDDWVKLTNEEKYFIEHILAFFAGSDGIVLENLIENFACEVQVPEARAFYGFQAMIENVHCVSGDTKILTKNGHLPIDKLVDEQVDIWNGKQWSNVKIRYTGIDELFKVTLNNGMVLKCTPDHEWLIKNKDGVIKRILTKNLGTGMNLIRLKYPEFTRDRGMIYPYTHGFYCGYYMMSVKEHYSPIITLPVEHVKFITKLVTSKSEYFKSSDGYVTIDITKRLNKQIFYVPINELLEIKLLWLEGMFEYCGLVHDDRVNGQIITCMTLSKNFAINIQLLLTTINVSCYVEHVSTDIYRILIDDYNLEKLKHLGLMTNRMKRNETHIEDVYFLKTDTFSLYIKNVEKMQGVYDTYCFEEPINHTGVFNGILTGQSTTYSLLIDTFIEDPNRKLELFNAIQTIPCITKKADWAIKWIDKSRPFAERLVAFTVVEGIFFSGSFCAIFWLKSKGKMTRALGLSNEFIARDEGLHTDFGVLMYNKMRRKLSRERIIEIISEAVEIEKEFICDSLPCALIGMNSDLMYKYIQFVADRLLVQLGYEKEYNVENPFDFMNNIALSGKTNFFEKRTTEYQNASAVIKQTDKTFDFDEDF